MPRRQLQFDGVRRDHLAPNEHRAEHDLKTLEKVVAHDHDRGAAVGGAFAGTNRLDHRYGQTGGSGRDRAIELIHAFGAASVLGVVVHEHVVRYGEQLTFDVYLLRDDYLEATHVARIARVLQTVLVAFEEKFQKEPLQVK